MGLRRAAGTVDAAAQESGALSRKRQTVRRRDRSPRREDGALSDVGEAASYRIPRTASTEPSRISPLKSMRWSFRWAGHGKRPCAKDGDLPLYADDGSHPTAAGSYLAACVFHVSLFGEAPRGFSVSDALRLDRGVAASLHAVAWEYAINSASRHECGTTRLVPMTKNKSPGRDTSLDCTNCAP